ncbi:hypothetical protein [Flavobacterium sp.]|uniref:hypothetical protein n=1 Tax=Flavobacterium sp. TaxID=239 RepID=UPI00374D77D2
MKKLLLFLIVLFCSISYSQTFDGNLGSKSLNWSQDQKDFNSPPRVGISPMSIRLWDNYGGANAPSEWGSLLEINGRESHLDSQIYFDHTWNGGRILYRSAFYAQDTWESWRYLLDSKSDVESSGNLKIAGSRTSYILGNLCIGAPNTVSQTKLYVKESGDSNNIWRGRIIASGDINSVVIGEYNGKAWLGAHNSQLNAWSDLIIQAEGGNVGIGTTNPDSKLTIAGNIHAREVKVTLNAGVIVPDYVFANDYKLKSLQEVEEYIKQNSHLPEIPSAKEIEKNGLMLAEMNLNLLKKIEELTLHAIEQQKNITELTEIVKEQNKRLNSLESK